MNKKTFLIGEDLLNNIFTNLLGQAAKDVLPLVDAIRAIVADQSKNTEVTSKDVQS